MFFSIVSTCSKPPEKALTSAKTFSRAHSWKLLDGFKKKYWPVTGVTTFSEVFVSFSSFLSKLRNSDAKLADIFSDIFLFSKNWKEILKISLTKKANLGMPLGKWRRLKPVLGWSLGFGDLWFNSLLSTTQSEELYFCSQWLKLK